MIGLAPSTLFHTWASSFRMKTVEVLINAVKALIECSDPDPEADTAHRQITIPEKDVIHLTDWLYQPGDLVVQFNSLSCDTLVYLLNVVEVTTDGCVVCVPGWSEDDRNAYRDDHDAVYNNRLHRARLYYPGPDTPDLESDTGKRYGHILNGGKMEPLRLLRPASNGEQFREFEFNNGPNRHGPSSVTDRTVIIHTDVNHYGGAINVTKYEEKSILNGATNWISHYDDTNNITHGILEKQVGCPRYILPILGNEGVAIRVQE